MNIYLESILKYQIEDALSFSAQNTAYKCILKTYFKNVQVCQNINHLTVDEIFDLSK